MPSKNVLRFFQEDSFYHVYNRGVNKQVIFLDEQDYAVFLSFWKRCLGPEAETDKIGRQHRWFGDRLELLAFCLMPNHFHLLFYQHDSMAITEAMRSVTTAYVKYFNRKYERIGPLFQQRFRAAPIRNDSYLQHISRYIHLNPDKYEDWEWSSLPYYQARREASWVKPRRILELFKDSKEYMGFVADYKDYRDSLPKLDAEIGY